MEKTSNNSFPNSDELQIMVEAFSRGLSIAEISNIGTDVIEGLYAFAYNLYTARDYKDAEIVFQALCVYQHNDYRFWMGLAGCRQATNNCAGAIDAYGLAALAKGLKDPEPFFYSAKCFIHYNNKEGAADMLQVTLAVCEENNPDHVQFKEKALILQERLK